MAKKKDLLNTKNTKEMQKTKVYLIQGFNNFRIEENPNPVVNSFKKRASEIKQRFNHVFKTQNPIEDYPNIESIKFERV